VTGRDRGFQSSRRKPSTCQGSMRNFNTESFIVYTLSRKGIELTILPTNSIGWCKSNYHRIATTMFLCVLHNLDA
jgi:hypothetical protein